MSHHIVQEGDVCSVYADFKTFCTGTTAILVFHDEGIDDYLTAKARSGGHTIIWITKVESEKTTFNTDFPVGATVYDIG